MDGLRFLFERGSDLVALFVLAIGALLSLNMNILLNGRTMPGNTLAVFSPLMLALALIVLAFTFLMLAVVLLVLTFVLLALAICHKFAP